MITNNSIYKIDHIGIAVRSLKEVLAGYKKLGLDCREIEEVKEEQVRVALLPINNIRIELLEPTSEESVISKFIANRGEGVHHIALRVKNIEKRLRKLKESGIKLVDEHPRTGVGGAKVAFVHTKAIKVLIELVER